LLIRGVCGLRPGVAGISENIEVRSVVGRFLEHTRVFYFENNGTPRLYLSSADWMGRNFFNRIEACFPIENAALTQRILGDLVDLYWADSAQSWRLNNDGSYSRVPDNARHVIAQSVLLERLANH
jgi:polyphosphate kinase